MPLRSPRETNAALALAIAVNAASASCSALDVRRIGGRPDQDEVVPGDLPAADAVASGDEFLLGLGIVNEDEVGIAAPRRVERLAGPQREHMHGDAALLW